MKHSDAVWRAYEQRYGKVYDPAANAAAIEEQAKLNAKRKSLNAKARSER